MKRFLISNILLVFIVLLFFLFNGGMFSSIYFSPAQSFFTRLDYLLMGLFGALVFYLFLFVVRKISKGIMSKKLRDLFFYELNSIIIILLVFCLVFGYSVMYPNTFFSNLNAGYIEVRYMYIGVLYIVELFLLILIGMKWNKRLNSNQLPRK